MDINRIKRGISNRTHKFINERRGWKTDRKIVVIESDDWGSIRMPNRDVYEKMLNSGIRVDLSFINKYDTLASTDDFIQLYRVLRKYRDKNAKHPVITANTIMANPDFKKIRKNNFNKYYYEPFTKTLSRYPNHNFDIREEGIEEGLFFPQLHGREHLNVNRWMNYLQNNSKETHFAFESEYYGIGPKISLEGNPSFVQAFNSDVYNNEHSLERILEEGLQLFENIFNYKSKSFIAPNYYWNNEIEDVLAKNNVAYLQGSFMQKVPLSRNKYNYTGKVNRNNQIYLTRNVIFEPSMLIKKDWVADSLKQINSAFKLQKPAIICTHRVNFIGGIFEENRTKNLKLLDKLFSELLSIWPDIEFMTTVELGNLIKNEDSRG